MRRKKKKKKKKQTFGKDKVSQLFLGLKGGRVFQNGTKVRNLVTANNIHPARIEKRKRKGV